MPVTVYPNITVFADYFVRYVFSETVYQWC